MKTEEPQTPVFFTLTTAWGQVPAILIEETETRIVVQAIIGGRSQVLAFAKPQE